MWFQTYEHLPKFVAFGDQHFQVQKNGKNGRNASKVTEFYAETHRSEFSLVKLANLPCNQPEELLAQRENRFIQQ